VIFPLPDLCRRIYHPAGDTPSLPSVAGNPGAWMDVSLVSL
jgi:hypothetical protein